MRSSILTELKAKTDAMSQSAKSAALDQIFPEQRAKAGAMVLMSQLDSINNSLKTNITEAGSAKAAFQTMYDTVASSAQGAQVAQQNFEAQMAEGSAQVEAGVNRTKTAMYDQGGAVGFVADAYDHLSNVFDVFAPSMKAGMAAVGNSMQDADQQLTDSASNMSDTCQAVVQDFSDSADDAGAAWEQFLQEHWDSAEQAAVEHASNLKSDLDISTDAGKIGDSIGVGYTSAREKAIADARAQLQQEVNSDISVLNQGLAAIDQFRTQVGLAQLEAMKAVDVAQEDARESAHIKAIENYKPIDPYEDARESAKIAEMDPNYKAGAAKVYQYQQEQEAEKKKKKGGRGSGKSAEDIAQDLADAKAKYNSEKQELDLERQLADARQHVADVTDVAKAHTQDYAGMLDMIKQGLKQNAKAEEDATAEMKADLANKEGALADYKDKATQDLHDLALEEYNQQQILKELQREAADALTPLQENAQKAAQAISDLNDEASRMREYFQDLKDAASDEMLALQEQMKAVLGPMDEAISQHELDIEHMKSAAEDLANSTTASCSPKRKSLPSYSRSKPQTTGPKRLTSTTRK